MLGLSLIFLGKFFGNAEKMRMNMDEQTKMQIRKIIEDGAKVAIPLYSGSVDAGDAEVFGLGIKNIGDKEWFYINVECSGVVKGNDDISNCPADADDGISYIPKWRIEKNKLVDINIVILTENDYEGKYIYNVFICNSDSDVEDNSDCSDAGPLKQYDSMQKLYLDVS